MQGTCVCRRMRTGKGEGTQRWKCAEGPSERRELGGLVRGKNKEGTDGTGAEKTSPRVSGGVTESEPGGAAGSQRPWVLPEEETSYLCCLNGF